LAGSDDDEYEYSDGHSGVDGSDEGPLYVKLDLDDSNSVHVGLRVYTHKDVPVEIESKLG